MTDYSVSAEYSAETIILLEIYNPYIRKAYLKGRWKGSKWDLDHSFHRPSKSASLIKGLVSAEKEFIYRYNLVSAIIKYSIQL